MTNSGFIAGMGSVAAALFFLAAVLCYEYLRQTTTGSILFWAALVLSAIYLFVSLFWGVRATGLESFQVKGPEDQ